MARRNRAELAVEDEVAVYHCIQSDVRRALLCGVDPLSNQSFDHRKDWIRDRLEALAGLFGVKIAAFVMLPNHIHLIAVPQSADGLQRAIGEAHRRYSRMVNIREGWRGHLW